MSVVRREGSRHEALLSFKCGIGGGGWEPLTLQEYRRAHSSPTYLCIYSSNATHPRRSMLAVDLLREALI